MRTTRTAARWIGMLGLVLACSAFGPRAATALDNRVTTGAGEECCVAGDGTTGDYCGTKDANHWCCGEATCTDPEVCGEYYLQKVPTCKDCHYFECIPPQPAPVSRFLRFRRLNGPTLQLSR